MLVRHGIDRGIQDMDLRMGRLRFRIGGIPFGEGLVGGEPPSLNTLCSTLLGMFLT